MPHLRIITNHYFFVCSELAVTGIEARLMGLLVAASLTVLHLSVVCIWALWRHLLFIERI